MRHPSRENGRLIVHLAVIVCLLTAGQAETRKIVGYYYGKGRPDYELFDVPSERLTHLIYSHATPTARGDCEMAHPDIDLRNLLAVKSLKARNPRLLVLLSVGGWSGSTYFSDAAATPLTRKHFSESCLKIVDKYALDGLDIDWEYPVTGGKPTDHKRRDDKQNFVLLLKRLRNDLDAHGHGRQMLLTVASTGYRNHLEDLSLKEMASALDWFNLMGYDFNEMQSGFTSHHSGLFSWSPNEKLNQDAVHYANSDAAVRWYLSHGVAAEKIVLGVPFYGQIWAHVLDKDNGLNQPYEGRPGEDGTLSYREIEQSYLSTYTRYWDDQVKAPWLYNKTTKIMISYEDSESLAEKMKYVVQNHLGGVMFWDLGQDDKKATLLQAIHHELNEK